MTDETPLEARPARGRRLIIALACACTVLLLAAALSIGMFLSTLRSPGDDSAEAGFARDMSIHHGQAVEMAMLAVQRSDQSEIRTLGIDISLTQQAQIGMMRAWLRQWNLSPTGSGARMSWMQDSSAGDHAGMASAPPSNGGSMPGMASADEIGLLRKLSGAAFDGSFVELMIRHHNGGIVMADAVLRLDPDDQVRELAESIKRSQRSEIDALNQLKARLRATSG